jgi:hypothetical protein
VTTFLTSQFRWELGRARQDESGIEKQPILSLLSNSKTQPQAVEVGGQLRVVLSQALVAHTCNPNCWRQTLGR